MFTYLTRRLEAKQYHLKEKSLLHLNNPSSTPPPPRLLRPCSPNQINESHALQSHLIIHELTGTNAIPRC